MDDLTESEKALMWFAGAMHAMVEAGFASKTVDINHISPSGIALFDQLDASEYEIPNQQLRHLCDRYVEDDPEGEMYLVLLCYRDNRELIDQFLEQLEEREADDG